MKRIFTALCVAFVSVLAGAGEPVTPPKLKPTDPLPANAFIELAKTINPAVVNVFTTYLPKGRAGRDPFFDALQQFMGPQGGPQQAPQQSLGSGFIIREDGLILTNNHVIDRADIIKVQISETTKETYDAKLVGRDARTDIALIKIDAKRKLPFVKLGSSATTQVGEWVAAFGNPYGYGHSMTKGIISAVGREIDELNMFPFMQTDASINPGNSGGPLVNLQGQVVGVNTAIDARAQGIGFVIPIDNVKSILTDLEKNGGVPHAFLGVQMADIDEEGASSLNLENSEGALVTQVVPGSSAAKAGILPYDLIVEFNGTKVASSHDLTKAVAVVSIGKKVAVKVIRNGKSRTLSAVIATAPDANAIASAENRKAPGTIEAPYEAGFAMADYNNTLADTFNLPKLTQARPVVVAVDPSSEAAHSGLAPGDIILDVNRNAAKHAKEVAKSLRRGTINILRVLKQDRVVLISIRTK